MSSRRDFISRATLAAAAVGLPPALRAEIGRVGRKSARPYLDLAIRCGRWIERSTETVDGASRWPADPLKPDSVSIAFYNGMPGVVAFYAALYDASRDPAWLRLATGGADYLVREMKASADELDGGLYTGFAGLGYTFMCVEQAGGGSGYATAARDAAMALVSRARVIDNGVEWSDSNDIISGTAGTGLFLLQAGRRWKDKRLVGLAEKAGRRLLARGIPTNGGLMWLPGGAITRNYPNFSHGTSGVAYFLATLGQETGDRAFIDGALAGARYLDSIANRKDGATAIFHVSDGGEDRYYLSWCHGPVGTARLFYRLHQITGETRWTEWVDSLTKAVLGSGVPEQRTSGYWNNISQCCGNVGIGQYCIDLARYHRSPAISAYRERVVTNTIERAENDDAGLRWIQAENRTEPENLVAQTGFMQGAAGVGTFFLQLDAFQRAERWRFPQPDTPFVG